MRRGDVVLVALQGDFRKPRPALVIQSNLVPEYFRTVTLLPITSDIEAAPHFRITVDPSPRNGLRLVSQVMVDKAMTHVRDKIGQVVGALGEDTMTKVDRALALWLGLA